MKPTIDSNGLEQNLRKLTLTAAGLLILLTVTLISVQILLQSQLQSMHRTFLPLQQGITRLQTDLSKAFEHQSMLNSARNLQEFSAIPSDQQLITSLQQDLKTLQMRSDEVPPEVSSRMQALDPRLNRFLSAEHALRVSLKQRHNLQQRYLERKDKTEQALKGLIQQVQAILGISRLNFTLLLRQLDGPNVSPLLLHELTRGDIRARKNMSQALVESLLKLGVVTGRIGTATSLDELRSLKANELNQLNRQFSDDLLALTSLVEHEPDLQARVASLTKVQAQFFDELANATNATSLFSLRRTMLEESLNSLALRDESIAAAESLSKGMEEVEKAITEAISQVTLSSENTILGTVVWILLVVVIGSALSYMAAVRIRQSVTTLRENNALLLNLSSSLESMNNSLEEQVEQRTQALEERKRSIQMMLDNMGDGILSVTLAGDVLPERSRAIEHWFGSESAQETKIWSLLYPHDPEEQFNFELGFEQLASEILPFDVAAAQLPQTLIAGTRTLEMQCRPISDADALTGIVIVIRDITDRLEAARADQDARELQTIVGNMLSDRQGFLLTFEEISNLIYKLASDLEQRELMHTLHTLKGNCATYGFLSVSRCIHDIETAVLEREDGLDIMEYDAIRMAWNRAIQRISQWMDNSTEQAVEVQNSDLEQLRSSLINRQDHALILTQLERWQYPTLRRIFQRLGGQVTRIARGLGKEVQLETFDRSVRIRPDLNAFWTTLIHVLRNALDHGIESPDERQLAGKPLQGRLRLSATQLADGSVLIQIEDDGRGIQVETLKRKAKSQGLSYEQFADPMELIFMEGISSSDEISEVSGRGVGMGAVREICLKLHINISVNSRPGKGTSFDFLVPPMHPFLPTFKPNIQRLL